MRQISAAGRIRLGVQPDTAYTLYLNLFNALYFLVFLFITVVFIVLKQIMFKIYNFFDNFNFNFVFVFFSLVQIYTPKKIYL